MFGRRGNTCRFVAIAAVLACVGVYADPAQEPGPNATPAKPETSAPAPAAREPAGPSGRSGQSVSFVGRGGGPVRVLEGGKESTLGTRGEIRIIGPPSNAPEYVREDGRSRKPRPEFRPARTKRIDKETPPPRRETASVKPASLIAPKRLIPGERPPR